MNDNMQVVSMDWESPENYELMPEKISKLIDIVSKLPSCVSTRNQHIKSLCEQAVIDGNVEALKILQNKGVNLSLPDKEGGWTFLHRAAETGQNDVIKFLVNLGIHVDVRWQFWDDTSLHRAVDSGHYTTVILLVSLGADMNAINFKGRSPLFYAIQNDHIPIVRYLVLNGADITLKLSGGETVLDYVVRKNKKHILHFLNNVLNRSKFGERDPRLIRNYAQ